MNDRELLELAAKAAGVVGAWDRMHQTYGDMWVEGINTGSPLFWNPLADDSDALRLLCKRSMRIVENHGGAYRAVQFTLNPETDDEAEHEIEIEWPHTPAATRYAITRAAAEIGASMQQSAPTN